MFSYLMKCLLGLLIVVVNSVIVIAFWRQKRLQTSPTNIYLTSLALCDLLTGLVVVPALTLSRYYIEVLARDVQRDLCDIIYVMTSACVTTTACHLFVISADRYVKIQHDFFYIKHSTPALAYCVCCVTYLLNVVISMYLLFFTNEYKHGCDYPFLVIEWYAYLLQSIPVMIFLLLPITLAIVLNVKVFNIANARKHQLQHTNENVIPNDEEIANCNQLLAIVIKEHKTALIIMAINTGYLITWPADAVIWFIFTYGPRTWVEQLEFMSELHPWLGLCNSVFNPIILFVMHSDFRHAIMNRIFTCPPAIY